MKGHLPERPCGTRCTSRLHEIARDDAVSPQPSPPYRYCLRLFHFFSAVFRNHLTRRRPSSQLLFPCNDTSTFQVFRFFQDKGNNIHPDAAYLPDCAVYVFTSKTIVARDESLHQITNCNLLPRAHISRLNNYNVARNPISRPSPRPQDQHHQQSRHTDSRTPRRQDQPRRSPFVIPIIQHLPDILSPLCPRKKFCISQ